MDETPPASSPENDQRSRKRKNHMRPVRGRPPTHGGHLLTRALRGVKLDTIDQRSQVGVALRRVRESLWDHLGGKDNVTAPQAMLIDLIARQVVIVQSTFEYIASLETPVNDEERALVPVVMQHDRLQATLGGLLEKLGWERQARSVQSVGDVRSLLVGVAPPTP